MTKEEISCYLSVRIKNSELANKVQFELENHGITVFNPCSIPLSHLPPQEIPKEVANTCYEMMDKSGCTVLIARAGDDFGNDCASELGYTKGSGKPVFVFLTEGNIESARTRMAGVLPIHSGDFSDGVFANNIEDLVKLIKK